MNEPLYVYTSLQQVIKKERRTIVTVLSPLKCYSLEPGELRAVLGLKS